MQERNIHKLREPGVSFGNSMGIVDLDVLFKNS